MPDIAKQAIKDRCLSKEFNALTKFERRLLRMGATGAVLSHIVEDELERHPWKLFFYMPTPFPMPPPGRMIGFITLNVIYNAVAQTPKAKWARGLVKDSLKAELDPDYISAMLKETGKNVRVSKKKVGQYLWTTFSTDVKRVSLYHWNKIKAKREKRKADKKNSL